MKENQTHSIIHFFRNKNIFTRNSSINPLPNKPWFLHVNNSDSFENTAGNGEIARNEQFLHFPQCFLRVRRTFRHFHHVLNLSSANTWNSGRV